MAYAGFAGSTSALTALGIQRVGAARLPPAVYRHLPHPLSAPAQALVPSTPQTASPASRKLVAYPLPPAPDPARTRNSAPTARRSCRLSARAVTSPSGKRGRRAGRGGTRPPHHPARRVQGRASRIG